MPGDRLGLVCCEVISGNVSAVFAPLPIARQRTAINAERVPAARRESGVFDPRFPTLEIR